MTGSIFIRKKAGVIICLLLFVQISFGKNEKDLFLEGRFSEILSQDVKSLSQQGIYRYLWSAAAQALLSGGEADYALFQSHSYQVLKAIESKNTQWSRYIRAESQLLKSVLQYVQGQEVSALWSFRQAYFRMQELVAEDPSFAAARKSMGMIELALTTVPSEYTWLMDFLGLEASLRSGLAHLDSVPFEDEVYVEAKLFQAFWLSAILQRHDRALLLLSALRRTHGNTALVEYVKWLVYSRSHNSAKLVGEFNMNTPIPHSWWLLGGALLEGGDYRASLKVYERYISMISDQKAIQRSHYRRFVAYHLMGYTLKRDSLSSVFRFRESGIDQYGLYERDLNDKKADLLLRARLATDGGYLNRVGGLLEEYLGSQKESEITISEYHYRKARWMHIAGEMEDCVGYYQRVIELPFDGSYFAPNACLQLGYIFIQSDTQRAKMYLEKALGYKNHPYKRSIDAKANALIEELNTR